MRKIAAISALLLAATLTPGMWAQDTGQQNSNQPGEGRRSNQQMRGTAGTITAISGDTLTVKQAMGDGTLTVKLNDKTEYRKDREPAKLSDLKVGDFVIIRGEHTSESEIAASAVMAGPPGGGRFFVSSGPGGGDAMVNGNMVDLGKTFIVGEVKAIDGAKITVHRPDNQDQTIQADENTSFHKAGESITLPDIKAGDTIMGRGEVKDGVFVPATINVMDPQRMQMMRRRPAEQEKPPTQSPQPPR